MTKQEFMNLINEEIVMLDGATGSNMQKQGMPTGVCPEDWILKNSRVLIDLQKEYIKAGSRILYAPTFTSNRIKLEEYGLVDKISMMNQELVKLTKTAIAESCDILQDKRVFVAGDLTMTGKQLYPVGDLDFEELVDVYKEQIAYILMEGVDLFVIETMMSLNECRAALLAVKETCDLPVMVTLTFNDNLRTLYGTDPKTAILVLQKMGADAVGVNCSTGPDKMCEIVALMKEYAEVPIIAKPNAGLPKLVDNETVFSMGSEEFAKEMVKLVSAGASIVGGCCGTTPSHMKELKDKIKDIKPHSMINNRVRALATECNVLDIKLDGEFLVVGERINPTGKKEFQNELREGNLNSVVEMAVKQVEDGAKILDINMGMNGIDEKEMMLNAITEVMQACDVPLCIDSSHVSVIEAVLRVYPGRALINSISLEKEKIDKLLPLAKKYGAMFILLPLSERGLPKDLNEKIYIIDTIVEMAIQIGLTKEDIIVDGLVNTIGANSMAAIQTLETIKYCKEELGVATIVGLSNISFGLPERQYVNSTFLSLAIYGGLTMAIANPSQDLLMNTAFAADLLKGKEESDIRFIHRVSKRPVSVISNKDAIGSKNNDTTSLSGMNEDIKSDKTIDSETGKTYITSKTSETSLKEHEIFEAVLKGKKKHIIDLVTESLKKEVEPSYILNELLIPAINHVGELFDKQIYFLPQLISSAQTMEMAIDYLEPMLKKDTTEKKGVIVIATVSGDVHDIGKNLVVLMLKNYGFTVIDLGKDVASEHIIEVAKKEDADIIALSALMTTTMLEMKEVIRLKNEAGLRGKVIIGGAVITDSYAIEIGADGYAKDAGETVHVVKRLMNLTS